MILVAPAALIALGLAACGGNGASDANGFAQSRSSASTCSDDPSHGAIEWIDYTKGKSAKELFRDPKVAALAVAAKRGDTTRMRALMNDGVDLNIQGVHGLTLLDWALRRGSRSAFDVLLAAGANSTAADSDGKTVVHDAAIADDTTYLAALLAHQADPNVGARDDGSTPLMAALMASCDRQFRMLVATKGVDLNRVDALGQTALLTAAQINAFARVLDLLEAGADPLARGRNGATFQKYLNMTPEHILSKESLERLTAIRAWLSEHQVPIEPRTS